MASSTRLIIWLLTEFLPLITAETVAMETPARRATSLMVEKPNDCFNSLASCRAAYRFKYSPTPRNTAHTWCGRYRLKRFRLTLLTRRWYKRTFAMRHLWSRRAILGASLAAATAPLKAARDWDVEITQL